MLTKASSFWEVSGEAFCVLGLFNFKYSSFKKHSDKSFLPFLSGGWGGGIRQQ